ncbi:hypothetical protein, partial [Altererythrobacter sp. MF3-039]|uniref:hypothetical protein n=1 Tax=Altererythrobacter sp. MF3-039 TaxID=3252901 RepID=UPI00390C6FFD
VLYRVRHDARISRDAVVHEPDRSELRRRGELEKHPHVGDADGRIVGANRTATEMLDLRANIGASAGGWPHADEVFAVPYGDLFSAA